VPASASILVLTGRADDTLVQTEGQAVQFPIREA
jgi:hypothetical protein